MVQEVRENAATDLRVISAAIRLAVKRAHGVEPRAIVLVASRSVIKTSSGKIARRACRDAYAHEELSTLFEWRESRLSGPHNPPRFAPSAASWMTGSEPSSTP